MLESLLRDLPLGDTEIHFCGSLQADALYQALTQLATSRAVQHSQLQGSLGADPLGEMASSGLAIGSLENIAKLVQKVQDHSPGLQVIQVNGAQIQNAGSTLVEELAYGLSMASDYMALLLDRGIDPERAQASMRMVLSTGSNYFMEIAKLRAARLLWQKIAEAYGVPAASAGIRIHAITAEWNLTLYDPHVNMLRGTTEAMSAVLGGADMLSVLPYDYRYQEGNKFSDRIARNVQIILREEAYFAQVADPAAGSYYLESLTDSVAQAAWALFQETESHGGFRKAFEMGLIQENVRKSRLKKSKRSASGKGRILGTNAFPNFHEMILDQLVEKNAGSLTGQKKPSEDSAFPALEPYQLSASFEDLRLETEKSKIRPRVLLFKYGHPVWASARASFSGNFFACAGYEIVDLPPFASLGEGIKHSLEKNYELVVLCSSDEAYAEIAPEVYQALGKQSKVVVAGYPADSMETLQRAGLEHFIHMKCNLLETLQQFNKLLLQD